MLSIFFKMGHSWCHISSMCMCNVVCEVKMIWLNLMTLLSKAWLKLKLLCLDYGCSLNACEIILQVHATICLSV